MSKRNPHELTRAWDITRRGQQGYPGDIRGGQNKNRKRGYKSLGRTSGDTRGDQRAGLRPLEDLALRDPRGPWGKPALLVGNVKEEIGGRKGGLGRARLGNPRKN